MKPGQLELTLDYPQCMALGGTCARLACPYNLGERALTRCAMQVAMTYGELTVSEIAEITGDDREYLDRILRSAIRKLGPELAVILGETYEPGKRPCAWCRRMFLPTVARTRLCSDDCRERSKRWNLSRWATKERVARAARRAQ